MLSVFFHFGMFMLFYQYGMPIQEKPEKMLPVQVMLLKDKPLVSIHAPESASEPKALTRRPAPIITSYKLPTKVSEPDLAEDRAVPQLDTAQLLTSRSLNNRREAKTAAAQRVTNLGKSWSSAPSVDSLIHEEEPAIELEPTDGLIALSASKRRIPAPDSKAVIRPKSQQFAKAGADTSPGNIASMGPRMLKPEDEPVALKMDRPPTIPFPGSIRGASFMLIVDTSGSVKGNPLQGIKTSAIEFISLMGPKDRVGLMTFNDTTQVINGFTSKNESLKYSIKGLRTAGKSTVLIDSLLEAGQILKTEQSENLHIVLFSDGKDEGSQANLDQVIRTLKDLKISVLAVGYTRVEKEYLDNLRKIADGTGGVFVQTPEFKDILALYKSASPVSGTAPAISERSEGAILIKSDPANARIYINGEYLGPAPRVVRLPTGKYNVLLQSDGYYEWQAQIELSEPEEVPLFIRLQSIR